MSQHIFLQTSLDAISQSLLMTAPGIFQDSHEAMRSLMCHKEQKSVCALVLAIVNEAQTL